MSFYTCFHNTYNSIEIALCQNDSILNKILIPKERASADLVNQIDKLFKSHNFVVTDIECLIVNQGPAPFTTLRTMIATVNGISFATKIPLIGVDGLTTFVEEYGCPEHMPTVALLNAFNKAVYYAIATEINKTPLIGYESVAKILDSINEQFVSTNIRFIGNATLLYKKEIQDIVGNRAYIAEPLPEIASIDAIFKQGKKQWLKKQNMCKQLEPLYLKKPLT